MNSCKHVIAAAFVASLVACGGGGDASNPTNLTPIALQTPPAPTPIFEPTPALPSHYHYVPNGSGGNYGLNCVYDSNTGLIWEGKNPNPSSLNYVGRRYTNLDSITAHQISVHASTPAVPTPDEVNAATNSIGFQNRMNKAAFCGFTNWRLPSSAELNSLKESTPVRVPKINLTWFPYTPYGWYWEAGTDPENELSSITDFQSMSSHSAGGNRFYYLAHIRLVRSAP